MRKAAIILGCVVVAAGIAVAVAAATGSFDSSSAPSPDHAATNGQPRIYVVGAGALRVRGDGFKPGERVRISVKGSSKGPKRTATTRRDGTFVASLGRMNGCDSVTVVAIGDRGSRASFNLSSFVCR